MSRVVVNVLQPCGRWEHAMYAASYAFTAIIGVSVILDPPGTGVKSALGAALTIVWAIFIMTSAICIPATLRARYRIEYALLPFFTTALGVAVLAAWLHAVSDPLLVPRASAATALITMFIARWIGLRRIIQASERH